MARFTELFKPGNIGTLKLDNRIIMAPMGHPTADEEGYFSDRAIDYYVARARGGVGLIISGALEIMRSGGSPHRPKIYDDKFIPRLRELTDAVHKAGGKIAIQMVHRGKVLASKRLFYDDPKKMQEIDVIAPSPVPFAMMDGFVPREMTKADIAHVIDCYSEGARRARDAGFDGVEYHGAHGYLIGQFLSGYTNRRKDEYGGSLENRARFACEILESTRRKVGKSFPVWMRISACDFLQYGITLKDTLVQAPMLVEAGSDAIHVSASAEETTEWQFLSYLFPDAAIVHLAEAVKKVVKVPVIAVGKLGDPAVAEQVLKEGKADFVANGRQFMADPEWPNKVKEGRLDEVRRCIYCNNCMARGQAIRISFGGLFCTVNPALTREKSFEISRAPVSKKVMVVGGGLAGMAAARDLAARGHQVSLYEKSNELGGQWNIACMQEDKKKYYPLLTARLRRELDKAGVIIRLNSDVSATTVKQAKPDTVVVATGAVPSTPNIPGISSGIVVQALDVITGKAKVGNTVVVVGGRLRGMEIADLIASWGKNVFLVTRHQVGRDVEQNTYRALRDRLIKQGVFMFPDSPQVEVTQHGIYIAHNRQLLFLAADTVVLAVGAEPVNKLAAELKGIVPELYTIGDSKKPGDALDAIRDGAEVARQV